MLLSEIKIVSLKATSLSLRLVEKIENKDFKYIPFDILNAEVARCNIIFCMLQIMQGEISIDNNVEQLSQNSFDDFIRNLKSAGDYLSNLECTLNKVAVYGELK